MGTYFYVVKSIVDNYNTNNADRKECDVHNILYNSTKEGELVPGCVKCKLYNVGCVLNRCRLCIK